MLLILLILSSVTISNILGYVIDVCSTKISLNNLKDHHLKLGVEFLF